MSFCFYLVFGQSGRGQTLLFLGIRIAPTIRLTVTRERPPELTNSTPEKGNIRCIPGSHRKIIEHEERFDNDNILSRGQSVPKVDVSEAVDFPLRAGQFSIHHELLVHGSSPNKTKSRRPGISFACVPTEAKPLSGPDTGFLLLVKIIPVIGFLIKNHHLISIQWVWKNLNPFRLRTVTPIPQN